MVRPIYTLDSEPCRIPPKTAEAVAFTRAQLPKWTTSILKQSSGSFAYPATFDWTHVAAGVVGFAIGSGLTYFVISQIAKFAPLLFARR